MRGEMGKKRTREQTPESEILLRVVNEAYSIEFGTSGVAFKVTGILSNYRHTLGQVTAKRKKRKAERIKVEKKA